MVLAEPPDAGVSAAILKEWQHAVADLWRAFEAEPVEDGMIHPAEQIVEEYAELLAGIAPRQLVSMLAEEGGEFAASAIVLHWSLRDSQKRLACGSASGFQLETGTSPLDCQAWRMEAWTSRSSTGFSRCSNSRCCGSGVGELGRPRWSCLHCRVIEIRCPGCLDMPKGVASDLSA